MSLTLRTTKQPVVCGVDSPVLLADEAPLWNILQSSNPPAHLLRPVELETNSEGRKEEIMMTQCSGMYSS